MSQMMSDRPADTEAALHRAFNEAVALPSSRVSSLAISPAQAREWSEEEAGYGLVAVDDQTGLTGGMRLHLSPPFNDLAAEWRAAYGRFDAALTPKKRDIEAVDKLEAEVRAEEEKRRKALEAIENELEADRRYGQAKEEFRNSEVLYTKKLNEHRGVEANMKAKTWTYRFSFILVLATECFINYHAFTSFWGGVPAAGLGTTMVIGALLAFVSHLHGEILKQWSFRFGRDRRPALRRSDWRLFGLADFGLLVALGFTGWSRYQVAAASVAAVVQDSATGASGLTVSPVQDVAVSLVANLAAWLLGMFIAYWAHDHDPDFMEATLQFWRRRRAYNRYHDKLLEDRQHVEAKFTKEIDNKTNEAETKRAGVAHEIDMLNQLRTRNATMERELEAVYRRNVEMYRDALVHAAMAASGRVQIVKAGSNTPFLPFDYKALNIPSPFATERLT